MGEISYRLHALQQMLDRGNSRPEVVGVIESGEHRGEPPNRPAAAHTAAARMGR